jgi:two-component system cell cycle response regulator
MAASPNDSSNGDNDSGDKTTVLRTDQLTLNKEIQKAKEQDGCLIIIRGTPQGHRFFISEQEMVMGRDPSTTISINDQSISRKHAKVNKVADGKISLTDLGSANGTQINGKKLAPNETVTLKYLPAGELEILFYGNLGNAAHSDPMTGIYNKGYLTEALEAEFKRTRALKGHLTLVFFDLDHFKNVNDTYGHDAGDYVLKEFTSMIKTKYVRPKDVFARYGGEEFVLLLPNTAVQEGAQIGEKIRAMAAAHAFMYEGKKLPVTSSVGVAELTASMESSTALLKTADQSLYVSKQTGRNKVTIAPSV